jgi:Ca2+ transporting ATPase
MVTGDHLETAKKIAVEAGIIAPEDINSEDVAMTGEQLRERLGPFECYTDQDTQLESIKFEHESAFKRINKKVRIIARATPIDKFILIRGIQQQSGMIGMAGDSIADSVALKTANVGFCMGTGCDVAKDNSDLIMEDNDFSSIMSSIQWGRATFINSRKFIVFQFTVSLAMLIICFISGIVLGNLPFSVLQMLWINLVMDILAAIALGTGREDSKDRISRKFKVFKPGMYRQIIIQAAFQIFITLIFVFFGGLMFGKTYVLVTMDPADENK